jgi:hypothetical protein
MDPTLVTGNDAWLEMGTIRFVHNLELKSARSGAGVAMVSEGVWTAVYVPEPAVRHKP